MALLSGTSESNDALPEIDTVLEQGLHLDPRIV